MSQAYKDASAAEAALKTDKVGMRIRHGLCRMCQVLSWALPHSPSRAVIRGFAVCADDRVGVPVGNIGRDGCYGQHGCCGRQADGVVDAARHGQVPVIAAGGNATPRNREKLLTAGQPYQRLGELISSSAAATATACADP